MGIEKSNIYTITNTFVWFDMIVTPNLAVFVRGTSLGMEIPEGSVGGWMGVGEGGVYLAMLGATRFV